MLYSKNLINMTKYNEIIKQVNKLAKRFEQITQTELSMADDANAKNPGTIEFYKGDDWETNPLNMGVLYTIVYFGKPKKSIEVRGFRNEYKWLQVYITIDGQFQIFEMGDKSDLYDSPLNVFYGNTKKTKENRLYLIKDEFHHIEKLNPSDISDLIHYWIDDNEYEHANENHIILEKYGDKEDGGVYKMFKKLIAQKKLRKHLNKYAKVVLDNISLEKKIQDFKDSKEGEDQEAIQIINKKIEVVEERIKSNKLYSDNYYKRLETSSTVKDLDLSQWLNNEKYIIDTALYEKRLDVLDLTKEEYKKKKEILKDRQGKVEQIKKKQKEEEEKLKKAKEQTTNAAGNNNTES